MAYSHTLQHPTAVLTKQLHVQLRKDAGVVPTFPRPGNVMEKGWGQGEWAVGRENLISKAYFHTVCVAKGMKLGRFLHRVH